MDRGRVLWPGRTGSWLSRWFFRGAARGARLSIRCLRSDARCFAQATIVRGVLPAEERPPFPRRFVRAALRSGCRVAAGGGVRRVAATVRSGCRVPTTRVSAARVRRGDRWRNEHNGGRQRYRGKILGARTGGPGHGFFPAPSVYRFRSMQFFNGIGRL